MSHQPHASIWLDVPEDCRMQAEFTGDRDIHLTFGEYGNQQNLLFERDALERFVSLANELLAVPLPEDYKAPLPVLVSPAD
jgi:hypothetical protein